MLEINLNKHGYVMIGEDIRVEYMKNNGKSAFVVNISVPDGMQIVRKKHFEAGVEEQAATGDANAQILAELLIEEHEDRRRVSEVRKAKQRVAREKNLERKKSS